MKLGKLLLSIVIVSLIVSMAIPLAAAPKPDKPPKPPPGGEDPPANPVIAFSRGGFVERLMVMNADGAQETMIYKDGKTQIHNPSWSPDGSAIAFRKYGHPYGQLWVIDVSVVDGKPTGSNARLLLDDCYPASPAWSPSGDVIAIASEMITGGYATVIQTVPMNGGTPTTLYSAAEGYAVSSPTWKSDASELAFVLSEIGASTHSIIVLDVATGTITASLLEGQFYPFSLDWARTQDVIAFEANGMVYTVDIATGIATPIAGTEGWDPSPSWSLDDSHIVFQGPRSDGRKVKSIDLSTGEVTTLTSKDGWFCDWSRHISA